MSRSPQKYARFNVPGHAHALTFSCFRNRNFLNYNRTRLYLTSALKRARGTHVLDTWAFVIMPDHVHLLIWPRNETYSISQILKSIKLPVAMRAISFLRTNHPEILRLMETGLKVPRYRFWQDGGGFDSNITECDEMLKLVEYLHNNPVRRGLVERPDAWYWSSARAWLYGDEQPLKIDRESFPIL